MIPTDASTAEDLYDAARRYLDAGLSLLPIEADGTKSPSRRRLPCVLDPDKGRWKRTWKPYQRRRPTEAEVDSWFFLPGDFGIAVVAGSVSGGAPGVGLEIIDFDTEELFSPWAELIDKAVPGLVRRLVMVRSPRPGRHVYYRCGEYGRNQKLACSAGIDEAGQRVQKTLIELKGEGGYCLVPPSPGSCHRSGRPYLCADGSPDLTRVPVITAAERAALLDAAKQFHTWAEQHRPRRGITPGPEPSHLERPGDAFNRRVAWDDVLRPHGWRADNWSGEVTYWRRPGKVSGTSATTGYCGPDGADLLYVFSTSADPFEGGRTYDKFTAYALLNHEGNFGMAAKVLRSLGFGRRRNRRP